MKLRRWKWIEDADDWDAFATWRAAQTPSARVELEAGLSMLLDYGPEHDCYKVGDSLYVVYACCQRKVFWLVVGVATPGQRRLVALAWGTKPTQSVIETGVAEAAKKLQEWRSSVQGRRTL